MSSGDVLLLSKDPALVRHCKKLAPVLGFALKTTPTTVNLLLNIVENDIELLVLDSKRMSGNLLKWVMVVRRFRPKIPVIVVTEPIDRQCETALHELGIFYLALRPLNTKILTKVITAALEFSRGEQSNNLKTGRMR